jgi:hypothetical protein
MSIWEQIKKYIGILGNFLWENIVTIVFILMVGFLFWHMYVIIFKIFLPAIDIIKNNIYKAIYKLVYIKIYEWLMKKIEYLKRFYWIIKQLIYFFFRRSKVKYKETKKKLVV